VLGIRYKFKHVTALKKKGYFALQNGIVIKISILLHTFWDTTNFKNV